MDILRVLASPDLEVRKKTLDLILEVVNTRNIHEVVIILKKEITKTHTEESATEDSGNYRQILVRTLHACSVKFPDVAESVVPVVSIFSSTALLLLVLVLYLVSAVVPAVVPVLVLISISSTL